MFTLKKHFFFIFLFLISVAHGGTMNRPKIGLVLSGGGAKGFAHIGTLKMLDSLQIPVDYIAGTSMGGNAGALYAIGYNGFDLEKLALRTDWQEIFSDKPPRAELPYVQKKETGKFQLVFGLRGLKPIIQSGLIYGQKISLLFSSLTFPYERISNFDGSPPINGKIHVLFHFENEEVELDIVNGTITADRPGHSDNSLVHGCSVLVERNGYVFPCLMKVQIEGDLE